jgi:hypothetical protein
VIIVGIGFKRIFMEEKHRLQDILSQENVGSAVKVGDVV